jgi:hypothetical protein
MGTIEAYRWRFFCPVRGRFITTKRPVPAHAIKWEYPDAEPVPGSRVIIDTIGDGDPESLRTSRILDDPKRNDGKP